jgi:HEAT repeat protein
MPKVFSTTRLLWLLLKLRSSDWSLRVQGAEKLGESKEHRAVSALVNLLEGRTPSLGGAIRAAFSRRGLLFPAAAGPNDGDRFPVREAAAKALGLIGDARAVPHLVIALEDAELRVRVEAARALGLIGDPGAVDPLVTLLKSQYAELREAAVIALAQLGAPAVKWLMAMLKYSAFESRQAAARALGLIRDKRALVPLVAALKDTDYQVRREVVEALACLCETADQPLLAALNDPSPEVRLAAVKAVGKIKDPAALVSLQSKLDDADGQVREAVWRALALLGWQPALAREEVMRAIAYGDFQRAIGAGAAAVEPLFEVFRSGDALLREKVIHTLVRIGPPAIRPLTATLQDNERDVRHAAVQVLSTLGWQPEDTAQRVRLAIATGRYDDTVAAGPVAVKFLIDNLRNTSDWDRRLSAKALGEIGEPAALDPLVSALVDPVYAVREAAATALGRIGGGAAINALNAALSDGHYNVRVAVRSALQKLGQPVADSLR